VPSLVGCERLQRGIISHREGAIWAADASTSITESFKGLGRSDSIASQHQRHYHPFLIINPLLVMGQTEGARLNLLVDQMSVNIQPPMPTLALLLVDKLLRTYRSVPSGFSSIMWASSTLS